MGGGCGAGGTGFEVAAVADDPINRFVTVEALQSSKGTVAGVAKPIRASDIVSANLPLDDLCCAPGGLRH